MSDYGDGNFMDKVLHWAPHPSPSGREILPMLDQTDNRLNPSNDAFLQTNQSEQRSGLVERVAARIGCNIPPIRTNNMSPFALFKNPIIVPLVIISPGLGTSVMLQSPSQLISPFSFPNGGYPETVEKSGDDHATTMIFNNNVRYQPMHFDLPPQEGSYVIPTDNSAHIPSHESHVDPIGAPFESEVADGTEIIKDEDKEYSEDDDTNTDDDRADGLVVKTPSPKRRKYKVSNMITAPRVILRMVTEEDHLFDGYHWRKYGRKFVRGNPNPRSYYRCTHNGCNMKKHVEREANNVKILVTTYDGIHGHAAPATPSSSSPGPKNRSGSSVLSRFGRPPFSSPWAPQDMRPFPYPSASAPRDMRPFPSSLNQGVDLRHLYVNGPVNQNHGFMAQNDEPKNDHVIPDGTERIRYRLFPNFGVKR